MRNLFILAALVVMAGCPTPTPAPPVPTEVVPVADSLPPENTSTTETTAPVFADPTAPPQVSIAPTTPATTVVPTK